MALPTSREETAVAGALAKSATFNAIQDALIGLHERVHGDQRTRIITGSFDILAGFTRGNMGSLDVAAATIGQAEHGIPIAIGERLTMLRVLARCEGGAASDLLAVLHLSTAAAGGSGHTESTYASAVAAASAVNQLLTLTPGAPAPLAANQQLTLFLSTPSTAGAKHVYRVEATVDWPYP